VIRVNDVVCVDRRTTADRDRDARERGEKLAAESDKEADIGLD